MDIFLVYVVIFGIVVGIHYKIEEIGVELLLESEDYIKGKDKNVKYIELLEIQYELAKQVRIGEIILFIILAVLFMFFPLFTLALSSLILALLTFLSVS